MAVQFHTLKISDVQTQTDNAISITFDVPEDLKPVFLYKAGQYITVKVIVNGVEHRRNYSLCSSPVNDEPLQIAVKKVSDGAVSQWLNEKAKSGMQIELYPPMGNFTKEFKAGQVRHYVLFAGGSGITPVMSIIKSILRVEDKSAVTLVYANRDEPSIIFDEQLEQIRSSNSDRMRIFHVLENNASNRAKTFDGRMDEKTTVKIIDEVVPNFDAVDAFVCGPGPMMDNVIRVLHGKGMDDQHIHREYFKIDKHPEQSSSNGAAEEVSDKIVTRKVRIRLYGEETEFEVEPDETILTAAQRADLDPPYACQIGACCTCRAKLTSGKAMMDEREALSDDEIEDGYILTCQAHPLTDGVFADYDK